MYAPVTLSVICTVNSAPRGPVAVSVFVVASHAYVTVSWPTTPVWPARPANEKPFAPAPSAPTLPTSVPVNVASFEPTSVVPLVGLPPVRPSSSTLAVDSLLSVGVLPSVIVKLSVASTTSPSPSVTRTVKFTVGTGSLSRPLFATNVHVWSALTVSLPSAPTVISLPRSYSWPATTTFVIAPSTSAPIADAQVPLSVAPSATDALSSMLTLGASSSNVIVSVLFVVSLPSASLMLYFNASVAGFSVSSPSAPSSVACSTLSSSVTVYAPVTLSVICTVNKAPRGPVAVSVFVAASQLYVTVS